MPSKILLVGEPMGLFIAKSEGPLDSVGEYSFAVAGAEFNVAVGMCRLGHDVGYLTKLGTDPFGKHILHLMAQNGISTELTQFSGERTTGFMLKSMVSHGDPEIYYYRKNSAASTLSAEDVAQLDLSAYSVLHMTGILPALSDSTRAATRLLLRLAREMELMFSFDPNLRPQLWPDEKTMVDFMNEVAAQSDVFLPGIAEAKILCGLQEPEAIAAHYLAAGAKLVVVKLGGKGAYYARKGEAGFVPGYTVKKVVDTVGAGDGFAAGLLSGLMEGLPLQSAVLRGNAIGAIQVMSRGDNDGLPTRAQLDAYMKEEEYHA